MLDRMMEKSGKFLFGAVATLLYFIASAIACLAVTAIVWVIAQGLNFFAVLQMGSETFAIISRVVFGSAFLICMLASFVGIPVTYECISE